MAAKPRKFRRPLPKLPYRKLFIIATEGIKTERQYFGMFGDKNSVIQVKCLKIRHGGSPHKVLKQLKDHLAKVDLRATDEAWIVFDKDQWTDEQLTELHQWSCQKSNRGFALSNPKFEFWLLLHFEDGVGVSSSRQCSTQLKKHLPDYDKGVDISKFTRQSIVAAVQRAGMRDSPPCVDWPRSSAGTTVYRLVEKLIGD